MLVCSKSLFRGSTAPPLLYFNCIYLVVPSQCFLFLIYVVGSVLRVVLSNVHQPDKTSSFVGICIQREECGLKAQFILRNVVDNLGTYFHARTLFYM